MPPAQRSASASATPKRAAATPGDPVTAAGRTSSYSAPGNTMAARPAHTAPPVPLTRIRSSTTPSPQVARRTGQTTTGADRIRSSHRLGLGGGAAPALGGERGKAEGHDAEAVGDCGGVQADGRAGEAGRDRGQAEGQVGEHV